MSYRVGMIGLGCSKNQVDAELMLACLRDFGFEIVSDIDMADAVVVNTCGFIEDAKRESIEEILSLGKRKQEGKLKAIVVTGCLAERYQREVLESIPEVDAVLGIGANATIAVVVEKALRGQKTESFPSKLDLPLSGARVQTTPRHYAYLKVAEGCDNRCSYCAIPLIRGAFRSRKMEDILKEAETLAQNGVKELLVIAQDTTRYGEDIYGQLMLPTLLERLCEISGIEWIRVLYCYPDRITDELLDVIAKNDKVLNYLDIPLQHCSGRILKAMNRSGDKDSLLKLIAKIRRKIPDVVLRTTFICGFPGETDEEFNELADFSQEIKFDRMGCFAYSAEEDTPAAQMADQVPIEMRQHRQEVMMREQLQIMDDIGERMIGKRIKVLVDGYRPSEDCFFGRSVADAPDVDGNVFFVAGNNKVTPGQFVTVEITQHISCDLSGILVSAAGGEENESAK